MKESLSKSVEVHGEPSSFPRTCRLCLAWSADLKMFCARWAYRACLQQIKKYIQIKIYDQYLEHFYKNKTDFVIEYLKNYRTKTGEYYYNLLTELDKKSSWNKTRFAEGKQSSFFTTMHPLPGCLGKGNVETSSLGIIGTSIIFSRPYGSFWLSTPTKT